MVLKTQQFVEKKLSKAKYKFDESIKEWVGWIEKTPGIYAQGKNIEAVRNDLAEILEEYLFITLQEKKKVQGFDIKIRSYAKSY